MYSLYKATNLVNGNFYIGITSRPLAERRQEHVSSALSGKGGGCPAFGAAIRKYGPDRFGWKALKTGLTRDAAVAAEIAAIAKYRPAYNISLGGDTGCAKAKQKPVVCVNTADRYDSVLIAARALGLSPMTISNLCRKGGQTKAGLRFRFADQAEVIRPVRDPADVEAGKRSRVEKLKARRYSPETIERMRLAAKVRGITEETRKAADMAKLRPIRCVETGEVFPHAAAAAQSVGLKRSTIYAMLCRPGSKTRSGLSFEHASAA